MPTMNTNALSTCFPTPAGQQIIRENMLLSMEELLKGETSIITLEGTQGSGKTTLLAQFAARHCQNSVALFIRSTSKYTFNPDIHIHDACNQLNFIAHGRELSDKEQADELRLQKLITTAAKQRRTSKPIYFIVDGLCDIPSEHSAIRDLIFGWLPLGLPTFRTIISGQCMTTSIANSKAKHRPFLLPSLTFHECEELLGPLFTKDMCKEAWTITKGHPEFVASIARLAQNGENAAELLRTLPSSLPAIYELEWSQAALDEKTKSSLAALAFSESPYPLNDLATLATAEPNELKNALSRIGFISIQGSNEHVSFLTDSHRTFARSKLAHLKQSTNKLVIDSLLKHPNNTNSLTLVPGYLKSAGRQDDLFSYLSAERLALMMERSHLRTLAEEGAAIGIEAAIANNRDADLVRLGIAASEIRNYSAYSASRTELNARLALGNYDEAIELAHAARLKTDRLRLLASIARHQKESGLACSEELHDAIGELSKAVEVKSKDEATDLAADLMYSRPEAAIRILDRLPELSSTEDGDDWAYARISLEANQAGFSDKGTLASIRGRIKDPNVGRAVEAFSFLIRDYSAKDVLAESEKFPSAGDRYFFFRQWAKQARNPEGAGTVLGSALDLLIGTTEATPTATGLRDLATALSLVKLEHEVKRLVLSFDAASVGTKDNGSSEDYLGLQLSIAKAQATYSTAAASERLVECYLFAADIETVTTRANCFAELSGALEAIDPHKKMESTDGLHSLVDEKLASDTEQLIRTSADHTEVTRKLIATLARTKPQVAIAIARKLNTQPRRDEAVVKITSELLRNTIKTIPLGILLPLRSIISNNGKWAEIVEMVLERYSRASSDDILLERKDSIRPFVHLARECDEPHARARALAYGHIISLRIGETDTEAPKTILGNIDALDDIPEKSELAFSLSSRVAKHDVELARNLLRLGEQTRARVGTNEANGLCVQTLKLSLRAFSGLLALLRQIA